MTPEEATKTSFDPFDVTKVWPRGELLCTMDIKYILTIR